MAIADLNLWDPGLAGLGVGLALATAFFLGMVHGITPDEHTWPITFNYAIGSYSVRGGFRAGLLFSLAFTLQRAIASELAYFAMSDFLAGARWNFTVYIVVGAVMAASGLFILRKGRVPHLFHSHALDNEARQERQIGAVHGRRQDRVDDERKRAGPPPRQETVHERHIARQGRGLVAGLIIKRMTMKEVRDAALA